MNVETIKRRNFSQTQNRRVLINNPEWQKMSAHSERWSSG